MSLPESSASPAAEQSEYLSMAEFCRLARRRGIGFSRSHLSRLALQGTLRARKIRGRWFVARRDAECFLDADGRPRRPDRTKNPSSRSATRRARAAVSRIHFLTLQSGDKQ